MRDGVQLVAIVKGKVQGVGFRAAAKYLADDLKLTGFVRNLSDGSVEICAQGEKSQLEKFLSLIQQKFSSEYIETIDTNFSPPTQIYSDFKIAR